MALDSFNLRSEAGRFVPLPSRVSRKRRALPCDSKGGRADTTCLQGAHRHWPPVPECSPTIEQWPIIHYHSGRISDLAQSSEALRAAGLGFNVPCGDIEPTGGMASRNPAWG
jgi:hypothetical protein